MNNLMVIIAKLSKIYNYRDFQVKEFDNFLTNRRDMAQQTLKIKDLMLATQPGVVAEVKFKKEGKVR